MPRQRVLVTGANGNLGQDLLAKLTLDNTYEVLGSTSQQLNLTWDAAQIKAILDDLKPDAIINTAAFTHVDGAETEKDLALQINALGVEALANWSADHQAYFIHISTDYVFEGTKGSVYIPSDSPHPVNYYGESKLAGEKAVLECLPNNAAVLRTSWLFGSGNKNFVPFVLHAAENQTPVRIANDQWGTPTWTGNLSTMIIEMLADRPNGVLHGCAKGRVSRYDQALFLCQCMGISPQLMTPVPTATFNFAARRPQDTAMQSSFDSALDWQAATVGFLELQGRLKAHV